MGPSKDISGQPFGLLTAVQPAGRGSNRSWIWICKCACGNEKTVDGARLRQGGVKSCGCLLYNPLARFSPTELRIRAGLRTYRKTAKDRHRAFELTEKEFRVLFTSTCEYCGQCPAFGLDRKDNAKGYTLENSAPCCAICNYAKRTLTLDEFKAWIRRAYHWMER